MARVNRSVVIFGAIFFVLVLALFHVTPVRADAGDLPEDTAVEATPSPFDENNEEATTTASTSYEELTATPEPTDSPQDVDGEDSTEQTSTPIIEDVAGDDPTAQQQFVDLLSENDLVLTDDQGNTIPMASQEGSEAAEASDPYFMAGGVYYGFSSGSSCASVVLPGNCTTGLPNPIQSAITAYGTTLGATGAIYLEGGDYNLSASLSISSLPTLTGLIGTGSASTNLIFDSGTALQISNTTAGFTLQGLNISGSINSGGGVALVDFDSNTGALVIKDVVVKNTNSDGNGIQVTSQTGTVTLNSVQSSQNGERGAEIDATGNVVITNSEFDLNYADTGLKVSTTGSVTFDGVSASENYGTGAEIYAKKGITIKNSLFETNLNSYGSGIGLLIKSGTSGAISITNVLASHNYGTNIDIEGVNSAITMNTIEANESNNNVGIYIDNCNSSGGVCTSTVAGAVNLSNITVNNNSKSNIVVNASGAIILNNVNAKSSNGGSGGALYNYEAKTPVVVSVTNGDFSYCVWTNLNIWTKGNVTLNHIVADYSANENGIAIDATYGTGTITILNTAGTNSAYGNEEYGLFIFSKGAVTINQIDASQNDNTGIYIDNYSGSGNVLMKNITANSNNYDNTGDASVYIYTRGTVTITNADSNNGYGIGLWIKNEDASSAKAVTITTLNANYNDNDGMVIYSRGLVTLNGLYLYENNEITGSFGIYVDNSIGTAGITINGFSSFYNLYGLRLISKGSVTVNNFEGRYNQLYGLWIDNTASTAGATVTVSSSTISGNEQYGMFIVSKGTIKLTSTSANYNNTSGSCTDCGAVINNSSGAGGVIMTGTSNALNTFYDNTKSSGLEIHTNGPVNISYIETSNNDSYGLYINDGGTASVTVSYIFASSNGYSGIYITAKGNITVNNPVADYNLNSITVPGAGIYLDNTAGSGNVTVQRIGTKCAQYYDSCESYYNRDSGNTLGYGLQIFSNGAVTVKYLIASYSPQGGILIDNSSGSGAVILTGITANYNNAAGINILSKGAVTLTSMEVIYNSGSNGVGISVDNHAGTATNVSLSNAYVYSNSSSGINILSAGTVTLAGVTSNNNTSLGSGYGLYVDNSFGSGGIKITNYGTTGNNFNYNPAYGIYLTTHGSITISSTTANNNTASNIYLNNSSAAGPVIFYKVTVTNSDNAYGIYIRTKGSITMTYVNTYGNYWTELDVDNTSGTGYVTLINCSFDGSDTGSGIYVQSHGAITLTNTSSENNSNGWAAYLDNQGATVGTPGITVQNSGSAMNEFLYNDTGLEIRTNGPVKVTNTEASWITNAAIYIMNSTGSSPVTLTKIIGISYDSYGIAVITKGAVTGSNISGDGAYDSYGVYIDNCQFDGLSCTGSGAISLNGVTANYSGVGLAVYTVSSVMVTNLTAKSNSNSGGNGIGAFIYNAYSPSTAPVTVTKSTVSNNSYTGLYVESLGTVTLDGITAMSNNQSGDTGGNGVEVYNAAGTGNVIVSSTKGANSFMQTSDGDGLRVTTKGTITVTNATANDNGHYGLYLVTSGTGKAITLNTVTVKYNSYDGIYAEATAASTFTNLRVYDNSIYNGYCGINVNTNGNNLTIVNSYLSGNGKQGIYAMIGAAKTLTLKNTFYFGNGRYGTSDWANLYTDGKLVIL